MAELSIILPEHEKNYEDMRASLQTHRRIVSNVGLLISQIRVLYPEQMKALPDKL